MEWFILSSAPEKSKEKTKQKKKNKMNESMKKNGREQVKHWEVKYKNENGRERTGQRRKASRYT